MHFIFMRVLARIWEPGTVAPPILNNYGSRHMTDANVVRV